MPNVSLLASMALLAVALPARAVMLERTVSREDPKFNCAAAVMTVGRDGNVYLSSEIQDGGYILRVSRDGTQKLGGDAVYAMSNATANAEGVIASANAHLNHSVNLYGATFKKFASCSEFLVNDTVQWNAPARVEAGASGDFYGLDQNRSRILRIRPDGKVKQVYALPADIKATSFRVAEASETFVVRDRDNVLRGVGFDGDLKWQRPIPGLFTVDDAGVVHALQGTKLRRFGRTGEPEGETDLPVTAVTAIAVFGDDLVVKRLRPGVGSGRRRLVTATGRN